MISGKTQRALRHKDIPDMHRRAYIEIRKEVARMEYIIKQLLDFSRRGPFRCCPADPATLAGSAASALKEEAKTSGAVITLAGADDCSPVAMDAMRIHQALINLLRNAIQCASTCNIRVSWEQRDEGICFSVEDDGPGVPSENRAEIFEPFFTTRPVGEGTGLGLAVVHSVAEEHGGWVEVGESEMGGACFQLMIPHQLSDYLPDKARGKDKP